MNSYQGLAAYYDRLMQTDYAARADYLLSLFKLHGAAPRSLLDLACGSGQLTAELAARGLDMTGVDASAEMLSLATERVPEEVLLLCQPMQALDLYDTVDGCVCTMDGFNHLIRTADIAATLMRLRLFIAPGGLLIFDVNTPYKHRVLLGDRDFVLEDDGLLCAWQNRCTPRTGEVRMTLDFFEEQPDGTYIRTGDEIRERAYTLPTWRRLLADAGFETVAVYDDMTAAPATDDAERWVIVARNTRPADEYFAKEDEA